MPDIGPLTLYESKYLVARSSYWNATTATNQFRPAIAKYQAGSGIVSGQLLRNTIAVAGACIYILNEATKDVINATVTDAQGNYLFYNIPPGNYLVTCIDPSGLQASVAKHTTV